MKKILITGARSYVAWSLLKINKLFGKNKIYIGDSLKIAISFKSRFFSKKVIFPSPRYDFVNFKKFILNFVEKEKINFIYSTCEEVFYFSKIKNDLEKLGVKVFFDDFQKLKLLHSKNDFIQFINKQNFNIGIPKTIKIINYKQIENLKGNYIFKYEYSRFATNIFVNFEHKKFKKINNFIKLDKKNFLLAQEFIKGENICSLALAKNGILLGNIIYKNIITYKGGSGICFKFIENQKIDKFVRELVKKLDYTGFISFDYIKNGDDIYVIECNPRLISGIHLFDEEKDLFNIIFNFEGEFFPKKEKLKTFTLINLLSNFNKIFSCKKCFNLKNEILFYEKKLFFYQFYLFFYYSFLGFVKGKTFTEITTEDIEFNS